MSVNLLLYTLAAVPNAENRFAKKAAENAKKLEQNHF